MKVVINHQPVFRFTATNQTGKEVKMDASPNIGGEDTGFRPMEMLLAGLGGCSGIDIVNILKKKKQDFDSFTIEVNGDRNPDEVPSVFRKIHIDFKFTGATIVNEKVIQAVDLSVQKYCSVSKMLEKTAEIKYRIFVNQQEIVTINS